MMKNNALKRIVAESIESFLRRNVLTEGTETRNMTATKHYLYDRLGYNERKAMELIGAVKTSIPNVRGAKCKFLLGVTRMYLDNELTDGDAMMDLNRTLRLVASNAHVNEYDQNLNGMHCDELVKKFSSMARQDLDIQKAEVQQANIQGTNAYKIVNIDSYEDASEYSDYTTWCITYDSDMYNNYTHGGLGRFYFCLKDGFEDIPKTKGNGCPLDEYGLSMIAVSIEPDGAVNTVTCRWNHDNKGNDAIMSPMELSKVIGKNVYEVMPPYTQKEVKAKEAKLSDEIFEDTKDTLFDDENFLRDRNLEVFYTQLDGGKGNYYDDEEEAVDIHYVAISSRYGNLYNELNIDKYVIMDWRTQKLFINEVFDKVCDWKQNYGFIVQKGEKKNILRNDGTYVFKDWYKEVRFFYNLNVIVFNGKTFGLYSLKQNRFFGDKLFTSIDNCGKFAYFCYNSTTDIDLYTKDGELLSKSLRSYDKVSSEIVFLQGDDGMNTLYVVSNEYPYVKQASTLKFNYGFGFRGSSNYEVSVGKDSTGVRGEKYQIDYEALKTYKENEDGTLTLIEDLGKEERSKYSTNIQNVLNNKSKSFSPRDYIKK
jgi:hypothetical protein